MRYVLFLGITHRRMIILYRRFGTTYRSNLQDQEVQEEGEGKKKTSLPLKMGPISCPETPKSSHQHTLRHVPEERTPEVWLFGNGIVTPMLCYVTCLGLHRDCREMGGSRVVLLISVHKTE
jgi:hypothetical protein